MDPDLTAALPGLPHFEWTDPAAERRQMRALLEAHAGTALPGEDRLLIADREIGESGPRVRIYTPRDRTTPAPAVLFFHGGGFTAGDLDSEHGLAVRTANDADCVVVSVDYRLAPENPFPAAINDGWDTLQWMVGRGGASRHRHESNRLGWRQRRSQSTAGIALLARDPEGLRSSSNCSSSQCSTIAARPDP